MTEIATQISNESAWELRGLAVTLGQVGLMEWGDVRDFLKKEQEEIAPLIGPVATLFTDNLRGDVDATDAMRIPVVGSVPVRNGDAPRSALVLDKLKPYYRVAREASPQEYPLSTRAKRFLASLLEPRSVEFWERLDLNGLQAAVFGETMIADFKNLSRSFATSPEAQVNGVRMHLAGHSDKQIMNTHGLASVDAIRMFRMRFKKMLLENYPSGRVTACRRFAYCLDSDQLAVLKVEFPEVFVEETF